MSPSPISTHLTGGYHAPVRARDSIVLSLTSAAVLQRVVESLSQSHISAAVPAAAAADDDNIVDRAGVNNVVARSLKIHNKKHSCC